MAQWRARLWRITLVTPSRTAQASAASTAAAGDGARLVALVAIGDARRRQHLPRAGQLAASVGWR